MPTASRPSRQACHCPCSLASGGIARRAARWHRNCPSLLADTAMALREAEPEHAGVGRGALRSAMRANTRAKELSRDALTVRSMGMAQATHIYGEVKNKTDLKKIFTGMRRDVGEARSRPDLTERFCQVVEAEMLIRQAGTSPQSYPPFRRPAPCLSLRPNSRIAAASLDDSRPLTTDAVAVESVG
jgi:hypothetical protein